MEVRASPASFLHVPSVVLPQPTPIALGKEVMWWGILRFGRFPQFLFCLCSYQPRETRLETWLESL